MKDLAQKSCL